MKKIRMVEFPPDITVNILSRLPALESILVCKCVCKTWKTVIEDPRFISTYINARHESYFSAGDGSKSLGFCIMGRQPGHGFGSCAVIHYGVYNSSEVGAGAGAGACFKVTKPPIKSPSPHNWFNQDQEDISSACWHLIGSSNGLICLSACLPAVIEQQQQHYTYTIYVYNPMTKEFVNLGPETFSNTYDDGYSTYSYRAMGFGYHPSTKEYKVIRINCRSSCYSSHVKVYTLGCKCRWRDKGEIPYRFTTLHKPGVLVNGALHWLTERGEIICFDLADEEFRTIEAPPGIRFNDALGTLGGCLCVFVTENTNVWVLREYMRKKSSWTKIFSLYNNIHKLLQEDEDFVLRSSYCTSFVTHFYCGKKNQILSFDSESGSISIVSNIGCLSDYVELDIVSYTKSFVSLEALGEEDVQHAGEKNIC